MSTDLSIEIAGLEAGYLSHLHQVNELDRIEIVFDRITRELDEMKSRLTDNNQTIQLTSRIYTPAQI